MQGTQSISKLLGNAEGTFQHLLTQAKLLQQLTEELRPYLPEILAPYCLVANLRGHCLVLHTDTAARATLLRYHTPTLIRHLQQHHGLHSLRRAIVKVRPLPPPPTIPLGPRPQLTPATAALLRNIASRLDDPRLKAALLRLAHRARSKPEQEPP